MLLTVPYQHDLRHILATREKGAIENIGRTPRSCGLF